MFDPNSSSVVSEKVVSGSVYHHPKWFRQVNLLVTTIILTVTTFGLVDHPAHAQTGTDLGTTIDNFTNGVKSFLAKAAPTVAVIAMLALGMMYMMSFLPVVKEWRESHPKAFSNVMLGVGVVLAASAVGGVLLNLNIQ